MVIELLQPPTAESFTASSQTVPKQAVFKGASGFSQPKAFS
jgi:hypothetical protein